MTTPNPNSTEVLRAEILADARREADKVLRRAREEADALLTKARAEAGKLRQERLDQARAEAAHRVELLLATVSIEAGQVRSAHIETLLQSVCDEARKRLLAREGFAYREAVIALAAEATGQMAGDAFVARLSPADCDAFGAALVTEVTQRVGRPSLTIALAADPTLSEGGIIVEDAEGRQMWDNRLAARLERLWPELRRQIAVQTSLVAAGSKTEGTP